MTARIRKLCWAACMAAIAAVLLVAVASAGPDTLPGHAPDGTLGYVWLSLGDGGNLYYTYRARTPKAAPPVERMPVPSAYDQTVTAPAPPAGRPLIVTSPALALFGAVSTP